MNHNIQTFKTNQHPVYTFSRKVFTEGMRDGFPIALGYFAVSFSLGIATRNAGLNPLQGFLASLLNNASAGEYAAFTLIAANATYLEVAIITLISNARYLLMSCALAQRFSEDTPFIHRLFIAYDVPRILQNVYPNVEVMLVVNRDLKFASPTQVNNAFGGI